MKCERCVEKGLSCSAPHKLSSRRGLIEQPQENMGLEIGFTPQSFSIPIHNGAALSLLPPASGLASVHPGLVYQQSLAAPDFEFPSEDYQYSPLRVDETIRVIFLHPGKSDDEVLVSFKHLKEDWPQYVALSYVWGNDPPNSVIRVLDSRNCGAVTGRRLYIRPNLYSALKALRQTNCDKPIWIDAICINQDDHQEKSAQIRRMTDIYSRANQVCVWLGSDCTRAFGLIIELRNIDKFGSQVETESRGEIWEALEDLMANKWFSRRWAIQEVAFAKTIIFLSGDKTLYWDDFESVLSLLLSRIDDVANLQENASFLKVDSSKRALPAAAIWRAARSFIRKSSNESIFQKTTTLESLVSQLAVFEATDPRDTIYALLSLAEDVNGFDVVVDYRKDVLEVYADFVVFCVKASESLDIICRPWAAYTSSRKRVRYSAAPSNKLPSWIPSVMGSPFATYNYPNDIVRLSGDSFVGFPGKKFYNASLGMKAKASVRTEQFGESTAMILCVKGFNIAKISALAQRAVEGMILIEWLEMGGWEPPEHGSGPSMPEGLWRTLVADRDPDGCKPPPWYRDACIACLSVPSRDRDINTRDLINDKRSPYPVVEFLKRVQSVIWNRTFFIATNKSKASHFGLGPAGARVGDEICIILGCSVPVLFRKQETPMEGCYTLVGEVYINGMMDGEAIQGLSEESAIEFRIV